MEKRKEALSLTAILAMGGVCLMSMAGCGPAVSGEQGRSVTVDQGVGQQPDRRFEKEILAFEDQDRQQAPPERAIVFTGSSSIRMWTGLSADFAPLPVVNRGFGGATLPELHAYADRIVFRYNPSVMVVYCGENDMAEQSPPPVVFQRFKKFMAAKESRLPAVPVLFLSAKPSLQRWHLWGQYRQFNALVKEYAANRPELHYLDVGQVLLTPAGEPDSSLFLADGLHLNAEGYRRWATLLKPVVEGIYLQEIPSAGISQGSGG
ncbi:MAG: hypothetical protein RLY31_2972 [Bacteroidota bacterium]|jgi:lysophospholipase L1-like esterase